MSTPDSSHKKILVVDDDMMAVRMTEGRLKANGYNVQTANDAPQGLEMAMKDKPDLIILDVMMPIVNGYNFCRLLKQDIHHRKIPVILLTSRAEEADIEIGHEVGADAYLTKPVDIEELLGKVKELLGP